jgi:N-acetylglucosaminyldiphosphoundecaprenol N-acetyl-beta-D-mannosaminyltransferase
MPIDAINMATVVQRIEAAAADRAAFLISTCNLNFLVNSRSDPEFRESLLDSDLCPPDGMPIVWIARLIGLPIKERVAGADILEWLRASRRARRLTIFLFGGAEGVAAAAARNLNAELGGLNCVGTIDPGFTSVCKMSQDFIIDAVNSSDADFLAVCLGAKKGQLWLQRNHNKLTIPIRAHLGAAINFQAGSVRRAPGKVRALGLEWLWRIKEEPYLWKRYWTDGCVLLHLLLTRVLPLVIATQWYRLRSKHLARDFLIESIQNHQSTVIGLRGVATERHIGKAVTYFQQVLTRKQNEVVIDLSETHFIDARFFGFLLMLRKQLKAQGAKLIFTGASSAIERLFRLNELGFLLSADLNL